MEQLERQELLASLELQGHRARKEWWVMLDPGARLALPGLREQRDHLEQMADLVLLELLEYRDFLESSVLPELLEQPVYQELQVE